MNKMLPYFDSMFTREVFLDHPYVAAFGFIYAMYHRDQFGLVRNELRFWLKPESSHSRYNGAPAYREDGFYLVYNSKPFWETDVY